MDYPNLVRDDSVGVITLSGQGLVDVFSGGATVSESNPGVTFTPNTLAWNRVTLDYSIPSSAAAGPSTLSLTTRFGTGSTTINIGDATPQLTGIYQDSAEQGDQIAHVYLNGYGFGSNPSVQISDSANINWTINNKSDTQIDLSMAIADTAAVGQDTVTVTSNGPTGQGFTSNPGQTATSNQALFMVNAGPKFTIVGPNGGPANQIISDGGTGTFGVNVTGGNAVAYQWSWSGPSGAALVPNVNFTAPTSQQTNTDSHWYAINPTTPNFCPADAATASTYYNAPYTIQATVTFDDGVSRRNITKKATLTASATYNPFAGIVDPDCNPGDQACQQLHESGGVIQDPVFRVTGTPTRGRTCGAGECAPGAPPPPASAGQFQIALNTLLLTATDSGAHYTATISPLNGFWGTVILSLAGIPAGSVGSLSSTSILLPQNGASVTVTGSFFPDPELAPGNYTLTVQGVGTNDQFATASASLVATVPPWHIVGMGNLARRIPTVAQVFVLPASQFYKKTVQHENKHLDQFQFGPGHIFGDLENPNDFYSRIQNLSAPTFTALEDQWIGALQNYEGTQHTAFNDRHCQSEQEAHNVSDPIDPQYVYSYCSCAAQKAVQF